MPVDCPAVDGRARLGIGRNAPLTTQAQQESRTTSLEQIDLELCFSWRVVCAKGSRGADHKRVLIDRDRQKATAKDY